MRRARLILASVLLGVTLVACGDDTPACAAPTPKPIDALRMPGAGSTYKPPPPARYTYKPPAQPRKQDTAPAYRSTTRPTSWKQYQPPHKWGQPYGKGRPVPQQPVIIVRHQHEYRTYPGYVGYWPVGVWPIGYGETYGCRPLQEGPPEDDD